MAIGPRLVPIVTLTSPDRVALFDGTTRGVLSEATLNRQSTVPGAAPGAAPGATVAAAPGGGADPAADGTPDASPAGRLAGAGAMRVAAGAVRSSSSSFWRSI